MLFNITPVASGYQEIHPYSAMNIDSVKINTSLIMMKEWNITMQGGIEDFSRIRSDEQTSLNPEMVNSCKDPFFPIN